MKLKLKRPLCFFDVEATGLHIIRDRVIQVGIVKMHPGDAPEEELNMLINPGIPISEEAMRITGITPDVVRNKPTFGQVAEQIFRFLEGCDLAGYNCNRFDIPILMEEFDRAGLDFSMDNRKIVDVQRIFYRMEPRTLKAAHKYYTGQTFEGAHDALADVKATAAVLAGQLDMYAERDYEDDNGVLERPIQPDVEALHAFTNDTAQIDVTQRLKYNSEGDIVFNFGKNGGRRVIDVFKEDPDYYRWIMKKEFSVQVKKIVDRIYREHVASEEGPSS